jgi:hypothetical protein
VRLFVLVLSLSAAAGAQDAREIIRRACEIDRKNVEAARNYTFVMRQVESDLDASGKVKKREDRTWDVTLLEGSQYKRLIRKNDKPLSPGEQQQEEEKLRKSVEDRRKETPEQHAKRIADWERRRKKEREPLQELPDAFNFRIVGEQPLNGEDTWVIDATPKPEYKPKSRASSIFPNVKARLWIGKDDYQWVKVDMETLDTISFGRLLVRIGKGGHLLMEQTRVNNEVWLPKSVKVRLAARILLVKGLRKDIEMEFSDYKKFQVESRVVSTQEKE